MKSKAFNRYKAYLYLLPSILILTVFTIYPLIKAIVMSFQEGYSIIDGSFDGINLANYIELFSDDVFVKALTNTSIYVVFVVPVSIILSLVLAVLINDTVRAKPVFQTIYFLPYVTSVIAIGIVWSWIFNSNYGLLNYILSFFGIPSIPWLNDPRYGGEILLAGKNFGCGSSREHAAWALADYGFRVVVSSFFADIHRQNELNNFVLPVVVSEDFLAELFASVAADASTLVTVDVPRQTITNEATGRSKHFELNGYKKYCLTHGLDDIDFLLQSRPLIEAWERQHTTTP